MVDFKKLIDKYDANIQEQIDLDNGLFETTDKGSWSNFLVRRATRLQEINKENTSIIEKINVAIEDDITEDEANTLYECALSFIETGLADTELHLPILRKLNRFYTKANNIARRVTCLYFIGYMESELLYRSGAIETISESWNKAIIGLKDHYNEIDDMITRSYFLMAYYSLAVVTNSTRETADESYKWYQEFMDFINSETFLSIDKDNDDFKGYIGMFKAHWRQFVFKPEDKNRPVYQFFKKDTEEYYNMLVEKQAEKKLMNFQIQFAHLIVQIVEGNLTFTEATYQYYETFKGITEIAETRHDIEFITYALIPVSQFMTDLAYEIENKRQRKSYFDLIYDGLMRIKGLTPNEVGINSLINQSLSDLCIKTTSCMSNKAEKEDKIFNLVIKRQVATYIHSNMVANIAKIIADEAYDANPKLFSQTGMDYGQILHYIEQAALLHDLGKIKITDIVNMQRRKLGEEEFTGVRRHPQNGADIVKSDSDLEIYADVMLGHHRFYDGAGGYPNNFDNTKSKYKIFIDIITIADCLDAATDSYSRNYKESISFEDVINELLAQSGTRYNPFIVRMINESPGLKFRLKKITMKYRLDLMYQAYSAGKEKYIL